ncbi:MAG: TOBE domain-containing protein, partial [Tardiphaga sp.]
PIAALSIGDAVDVFVRPEHLAVTSRGASGSLPGTVTTQVFQGGHVDLYIDAPGSAGERILLRSPGIATLSSCPVGAEIGLTIGSDDIVAFPPGEAA